jgi:hypothetical protein
MISFTSIMMANGWRSALYTSQGSSPGLNRLLH